MNAEIALGTIGQWESSLDAPDFPDFDGLRNHTSAYVDCIRQMMPNSVEILDYLQFAMDRTSAMFTARDVGDYDGTDGIRRHLIVIIAMLRREIAKTVPGPATALNRRDL